MSESCSVCKEPIVVPHCESKNCNWCKACHDKMTASKKS